MEPLSLQAIVPGKGSGRGVVSNACPDRGDEHLREHYQSEGLPNDPSQSTDESKTTIFCEDQGQDRVQCIQRQSFLCWEEGCNQQAEAGPMSREGEIDLFCLDHQSSDAIATRTEHCKFNGCLNTPKYGQQKGPLRFCQEHKRAGMYTNRNGQLLLATRDGSAFKDEDHIEATLGAILTSNFAVCKEFPSNIAGGNTAAQYRKTCEVPGCHIQPSYGPKGTTRPRFCSGHKKEGMVGLKNRPCIFPGCTTRPHYGLLGSRPIYCAKHKEANMVHLLKEATIREKMDATRDLGQGTSPPPEPMRSESKRLLPVTYSKEEKVRQKVLKKNVAMFQAGGHQEFDGREGSGGASPIPLSPSRQRRKQEKKKTGESGTDCQRKKVSSMPTASSSSISTRTPASSKIPAVSEKHVLKDVKESAQAELTTRGSGRRARIPSRKALEASGKVKNQETQWLTKEKKEEDARRMKEIRAQRKAAAAVGLKAGQVIETVTIDPTVSGEGPCTGGSGVGDGADSEPIRMVWRKLSPEEILDVAARKSTTNVVEKARPGRRGEVASGAEEMHNEMQGGDAKDASASTSEAKREEAVWTPQDTTKAITPKSDSVCPPDAKRREEFSGDQSVQIRQAMPSSDRKAPRDVSGWESTGKYAVTVGAGKVDEMKVCQYEDCSKRATFGVNGIERYCKLHALFGMHRINVPT